MRASTFGGWDVHAHLIPPALLAEGTVSRFGMRVEDGTLHVRGAAVPLDRITDVSALTAWVRRNRLDGALVSPPPPLYRPELSGRERQLWVALVNEALAEDCEASAVALRPLAYLPAEDPDLAAKVIAALGSEFAGVTLGTELAGRTYADAAYDRLFGSLAERGLPAFVHPGHSADPRLQDFYLTNLLGNAYETTLAAAHLVLGGVFDRHPALQVVLAHGGGAVAILAGRWQRGQETARPGLPESGHPPLATVRKLYVDTLVHSPAALELIVRVVGSDRLLLGSDWPFPMGAESAEGAMDGLSEEAKALARTETPQRVFGTRLAVPGRAPA